MNDICSNQKCLHENGDNFEDNCLIGLELDIFIDWLQARTKNAYVLDFPSTTMYFSKTHLQL